MRAVDQQLLEYVAEKMADLGGKTEPFHSIRQYQNYDYLVGQFGSYTDKMAVVGVNE